MPFQNRVYTTDMQDQQHTIRTRSLPAPALKKDGSQQILHLPHSGVGERGGNCLPGHAIHYNIVLHLPHSGM